MTMIGMLVAWIAAAAAGLFWWRRGVMATVEGTPARRKAVPTAPMRSVDPRQLGSAASQQIWVLRSDPNCAHSRSLSGRRTRGDRAVPLATLGCNPSTCSCHYQRAADGRRKSRRISTDRRDGIRFSTDSDRRASDERRRDARAWSPAHRAN